MSSEELAKRVRESIDWATQIIALSDVIVINRRDQHNDEEYKKFERFLQAMPHRSTAHGQFVLHRFNPTQIDMTMAVQDDWNNRVWFDFSKGKIWIDDVPQPDFLKALALFRKTTTQLLENLPARQEGKSILSMPYGNLYMNDHFVVYRNGRLYHRRGEPFTADRNAGYCPGSLGSTLRW